MDRVGSKKAVLKQRERAVACPCKTPKPEKATATTEAAETRTVGIRARVRPWICAICLGWPAGAYAFTWG
jgi:hypothetical protein